MKKALLHLGAHKTGSTAIQVQFYYNAPRLLQFGINYPTIFCSHQGRPLYGHHSLGFFFHDIEEVRDYCDAPDSIPSDLASLPRDAHLILSSEAFIELVPDQISRLRDSLAGFDCEILMYVRHQDESIQALYQTDVLHYGNSLSFEEYFQENFPRVDYYAIARRWAACFGRNKVHIRCYERSRFPERDITKDFVAAAEEILGSPVPLVYGHSFDAEINRGLPAHIVHLANYFNGRAGGASVTNRLRDLGNMMYAKAQGQYDIIMPSSRRNIMEFFKPGNKLLAEEFLRVVPGDNLFGVPPILGSDQEWLQENTVEGAHLEKLLRDVAVLLDNWSRKIAKASAPSPVPEAVVDGRQYTSLHALARTLELQDWIAALGDALEAPVVREGILLPGAPTARILQERCASLTPEGFFEPAAALYAYALRHVRDQKVSLARVLDLGCGWGLATRLFLRDVDEGNLFGAEWWDEAVQMARQHMPFAAFLTASEYPPLPFADSSFDLVFAATAFAHLPRTAALAWGREIARLLRPGGLLVAATLPEQVFAATDLTGRHPWARDLEAVGGKTAQALRTQAACGEFVFFQSSDSSCTTWDGWALLPEALIRREFEGLSVVECQGYPDPGMNLAPFVLRKDILAGDGEKGMGRDRATKGEELVDLDRAFARMDAGVVKTVSPRDEMFNYIRTRMPDVASTEQYYFDTGRELAVNLVTYLAKIGHNPASLSLLDFAAGYGRVTRWLAPLFGSVIMADLEQDMIDFQRQNFRVAGFVSGLGPDAVASLPVQADVVFVFSLFTHLPDSNWRRWLRALAGLVCPGGHLVFSTHSYQLFATLNPAQFGDPATWNQDFLFWETNETDGRLDTKEYGCNIVTESYVLGAVKELDGYAVKHHFSMGQFDRYHDIYVVGRRDGGA